MIDPAKVYTGKVTPDLQPPLPDPIPEPDPEPVTFELNKKDIKPCKFLVYCEVKSKYNIRNKVAEKSNHIVIGKARLEKYNDGLLIAGYSLQAHFSPTHLTKYKKLCFIPVNFSFLQISFQDAWSYLNTAFVLSKS